MPEYLPGDHVGPASSPNPDGGRGAVSGISVADVLSLSSLRTARLVAGASGSGRMVRRLNVMEVPDILPWVKPDELILTTGYPLRHRPSSLIQLIADLDDRGLAAFAIKLARYVDELPDGMLAEADRRGFPVILLPDDVGFDDILNQVLTEILNKQAAALAHSDEVHRAIVATLLAGGGLDEVTEKAAMLLSPAAVIVVGREGAILAKAGPEVNLSAGLVERIRAAHPLAHPVLELEAGGTAVVVSILAGEFDHGWLVAVREDDGHAADTVTILERAAGLAALTITQKLAVTAVEARYQSDLVRDLVEGRLDDLERVLDQARWFGWNIQSALVLAVTIVPPVSDKSPRSRHDELERFAARWRAVLETRVSGAAVVIFSDQVVTLLPVGRASNGDLSPADSPVPAATELITVVGARVQADRPSPQPVSTGISRGVDSLAALPAAYSQARRAAQVGLQTQKPEAVTSFDSLGVLRLLSLIPDSGELRAYLAEVLGPLVPDGSAEHADLLETLGVLLDANLNVAEAARNLHFHYNTLRYRIGKLERLLGPFMTDPSLRLNVQLALHLVEVHGLV